jgi:hypothetical protein
MTAFFPVAVAPNFHLGDGLAGHLLVADGAGWRPPSDSELRALAPACAAPGTPGRTVLLFALPGHVRASFWAMLEQGAVATGFDAFASEVAQFLTFKQLPPPAHAVIELILHGAAGTIEPHGLWAVVNLSDDPVLVGVPGLRVRLAAGEGCRLPDEATVAVIPPERDTPDALVLVRRGKQ